MSKYELFYIVSSNIPDTEVPQIADEVDKIIENLEGKIINEERMGRKKLAYPIKKTRNGFYVLVAFELDGTGLFELENKLKTVNGIIRSLVINVEAHESRQAKDVVMQEKLRKARHKREERQALAKEVLSHALPHPVQEIEINLDEDIEKALDTEKMAKEV